MSAGIGTRITSPEVAGFTPRSESRIAFSTTPTIFFSKGWIAMVRASASVTLATWLIGVSRAVVVHAQVVDQARVRAPGAHLGEVVLERLDGLRHLVGGLPAYVADAHMNDLPTW